MTRSVMRPTLALAIVAIAACSTREVKLDSNSGGDAARDQAMAVFIDRTVTDRLDAPGGDHTDWKYVDILDKGGLRVEVSVDTPEQLGKSFIELTDAFGNRLDRQLVSQGQTNYVFTREVETTPDKYYVRVFTEQGGSVYTVGVRLAYAPDPTPPPPPKRIVPDPEPEPEVKPRKRRRTRTRRPRPVKKDPTPPPPPPPPPPDPTPAAAPITGTVVRIIPTKDDQAVTLTVVVPSGSKVGASTHRAVAYKGGSALPASVSILKVSGRKITARLNEVPGQAAGTNKVKFIPR